MKRVPPQAPGKPRPREQPPSPMTDCLDVELGFS